MHYEMDEGVRSSCDDVRIGLKIIACIERTMRIELTFDRMLEVVNQWIGSDSVRALFQIVCRIEKSMGSEPLRCADFQEVPQWIYTRPGDSGISLKIIFHI